MKKKITLLLSLVIGNFIIFAATRTPDSTNGFRIDDCINGGPGATSCATGGSIHIEGVGGGGNCSVSCDNESYACCGWRCYCKPIGAPVGSGSSLGSSENP